MRVTDITINEHGFAVIIREGKRMSPDDSDRIEVVLVREPSLGCYRVESFVVHEHVRGTASAPGPYSGM